MDNTHLTSNNIKDHFVNKSDFLIGYIVNDIDYDTEISLTDEQKINSIIVKRNSFHEINWYLPIINTLDEIDKINISIGVFCGYKKIKWLLASDNQNMIYKKTYTACYKYRPNIWLGWNRNFLHNIRIFSYNKKTFDLDLQLIKSKL